MGIPYHWRRQTVSEIAEFFIRDVEHGIFDTEIRCGIIKVASGQDDVQFCPTTELVDGRHMGLFEQRAFAAAARAHPGFGKARSRCSPKV